MKNQKSFNLLPFTFYLLPFYLLTLLPFNLFAQEKLSYQIVTSTGEKTNYGKMISEIATADVVLFGELHNDAMSHWFELSLVESLFELKKNNLVVACEMWEADNQLLLDEAFEQNYYDEAMYLESSKLWSNVNDYLPILRFAVKNKLRFVGTNVPRRYARMVSRNGIESLNALSEQAKTYIAPLPILIDLQEVAYKNMLDQMPGGARMGKTSPENLATAQALKDATMAHFILKNWKKEKQVFHFHGEFHSAFYSGIMFYLKKQNPNLKIKTISIVKQDSLEMLSEENKNRADYIIIVPENFTETY